MGYFSGMQESGFFRLFKVAKELNVGSDTLVDYLQKKGYDLQNSPNTKLTSDQYNILLKEYANEKKQKEKASQFVENRKEPHKTIRRPDGSIEERDEYHDDSSNNKSGLLKRPKLTRPISEPKISIDEIISQEQEKVNVQEEPLPTLEINEPDPVVQAIVSEPQQPKIVGKIDLDQFKKKKETNNRQHENKREEKQVSPKKETEKEIITEIVVPSVEAVVPPVPVAPSIIDPPETIIQETPIPELKQEPKPTPISQIPEETMEQKEPIVIPDVMPTIGPLNGEQNAREKIEIPENKPITQEPIQDLSAVEQIIPGDNSENPQEDDESVIRANDHTPKLSGLTIKGKIELEPDRKLRKRNDDRGGNRDRGRDKDRTQDKTQKTTQPRESSGPPKELIKPKKLELTTNKDRADQRANNKLDRDKPRDDRDPNKTRDLELTPRVGSAPDSGTPRDLDDADKKKRRRKRKRKSAVKADIEPADAANKDKLKPKKAAPTNKKKDKPSQKEVEESIRQTMSQMSQGASRNRQRLRRAKRDADALRREHLQQLADEESLILNVTEFITANEFANLIEVPVNEIITKSFQLGMMISINQRLDAELISILCEEYGFKVNFVDISEQEIEDEDDYEPDGEPLERQPIITVMGHVDHGKTTLLDFLRKTNVTAGEAGGITQHIGAYEVGMQDGRRVTFIDTPGHEAFTAMRARGSKVTDVAIIVIAADDAVMPQTREAINHAQAASVPMVFAINKMDKPGANPERIKQQLAEMNLLVEEWGGSYQSQEISALKGSNIDLLLDKVFVESDLLELKATPDKSASGTVIESRLDRGLGNVATLLVKDGTLHVGDELVAGVHYCKVRALINQNNERIKTAGPSVPVQVLGLSGLPQAGDVFKVYKDEGKAKNVANRRQELFREQQLRSTKRLTLDEIGRRKAIGNFKELNLIIRADVDGSVEALAGSLLKLSTEEVQVNILLKSVGAITEGDVLLASASDAIIIAFNVRPSAKARLLSEKESIDIRMYSVIYDAINDVRDALEGLLSPEIREEILGTAEVRDVFKITKVGNVAGCLVLSGKINKVDPIRVIRDAVVIYDSKLASLKRFKDDVKDVVAGYEFGAMVENYNDIQPGDILESYRRNEFRRKL